MNTTLPAAIPTLLRGKPALRVPLRVRPGDALALPDGARCVAGRVLWRGDSHQLVARGRATVAAARARARVNAKPALRQSCVTTLRVERASIVVLRGEKVLRRFTALAFGSRALAMDAASEYARRIDADHARRFTQRNYETVSQQAMNAALARVVR